MLVLTRKKDQTLVIGDHIEITVLDIQGDQIRLGVDAPKSIKIYRKELYLEIQEENKNAAKPSAKIAPEHLKNLLNLPDTLNARDMGDLRETRDTGMRGKQEP